MSGRLTWWRNETSEEGAHEFEWRLARVLHKLGNEAFLSKAPANVVEGFRKRKAEVELLIEKIKSALDELN